MATALAHDAWHRLLTARAAGALAAACRYLGFPAHVPLFVPADLGRHVGGTCAGIRLTHGAGQGAPAVFLPFALHGVCREAREEALQEARRQAPCLILLDYRTAERNLDFPATWLTGAVERLACADHRAACADFMRQGGVEAFIKAPLYRATVCGGAATMAVMASPDP